MGAPVSRYLPETTQVVTFLCAYYNITCAVTSEQLLRLYQAVRIHTAKGHFQRFPVIARMQPAAHMQRVCVDSNITVLLSFFFDQGPAMAVMHIQLTGLCAAVDQKVDGLLLYQRL